MLSKLDQIRDTCHLSVLREHASGYEHMRLRQKVCHVKCSAIKTRIRQAKDVKTTNGFNHLWGVSTTPNLKLVSR